MTVEIGSGVGTRTLYDVAREKMRTRHMAYRTEQAYLQWIRRYVVFQGRRHPRDLGAAAVEQFLSHLAVERKVSASTQNQALQALLFLYRHVPGNGAAGNGAGSKFSKLLLSRQDCSCFSRIAG